jgi:serine protease
VRVLGRCGGYGSDIADGIRWAVGESVPNTTLNPYAAQVKVINLSLGGQYPCPYYMQTAIDAARAHGAVVVAAAGNNALDAAQFMPGSCSGVITVGATTRNGSLASYSNYGSLLEISAPGGQIGMISSDNNNDPGILSSVDFGSTLPVGSYYGYMNGTSMAAPHVSGIVSLMLSANPRLTGEQVLRILQRSASPFAPASPCGTNSACGAGIANAGRAVQDAASFYWIEWPTRYGRYGQAFAGDKAAPGTITIITLAANNPRKTVVSIGGVDAAVKNVVTSGGFDYLTVQPGAMPANGAFDLQVTLDGAAHLQPGSVFFGSQVYLAAVSR